MKSLDEIRLEIIRYYKLYPDRVATYENELIKLNSMTESNFINIVFPYDFVDQILSSPVELLSKHSVNYKGSELFYPDESTEQTLIWGTKLELCEQHKDSPHCYESPTKSGNILLDIGCSTGNYSLMNYDKYSEVHLFDNFIYKACTDKTFKGKNATFHPGFIDKVNSIDSFDLGKVSEIKLDIEGNEYDALMSGIDTIKRDHPKIQCCTYHQSNDFESIYNLLKSLGYTNIRTTKGYMIFPHSILNPPYFRNGLLIAE